MAKKIIKPARQSDEAAGGVTTEPELPVEARGSEKKAHRLNDDLQREQEYGIPAGALLQSSDFEHPYCREVYESAGAFHWLVRERRKVVDSGSVEKGDDPVAAQIATDEALATAISNVKG